MTSIKAVLHIAKIVDTDWKFLYTYLISLGWTLIFQYGGIDMNRKSMKISLISILISSTLFNMTNNTLANTEDDIEENNPEEYIEEQSEGDEFEDSTYESENDAYEEESTEETYETFNQTTVIEASEETAETEQDSENEEGSSVPEQEITEVNDEESESDENTEEAQDAGQEPADESDIETEQDDEILVPEEDFGGDRPEEPSEEPGQNDATGGSGGSEENRETGEDQSNIEQPENGNDGNEQTEPENQEDINDDVNGDAPIEESPESDETAEDKDGIDPEDGSGGGESSEGDTEFEGQEPGTDHEMSGDGNTESPDDTGDQNNGKQENQQSVNDGDLPYGSGGSASGPNGQETDYGSSDTDEANQTEGVIEGEQETGGEDQQTEAQQNKKSGAAGNKLYRYNYGDILNGIDLRPGTTEENYSTLDKRINRIMTSKIVQEDDMTEEEILELEEEIKNESGVVSASSDRDALPNTGDTNQYNYLYSFVLILAGGILFSLTKRPGNEQ